MKNTSLASSRLYYLDWLRVIAIGFVFLYHSDRFFDNGPWHVKSTELSIASSMFSNFVEIWIMPLFFVVSGAAVYYSLRSRTVKAFLRERVFRLVVPLVFQGMFVLAPPVVYLERLTHGQFAGSFFDFIPFYFQGLYGLGGNFAFHGLHLWYLMQLFLFSVIAAPLLMPFGKGGQNVLDRVAGRLKSGWGLTWLLLFFIFGELAGKAAGLEFTAQMGSWNILAYFSLFLGGYLAFASAPVRDFFVKSFWPASGSAVVLALYQLWFVFGSGGKGPVDLRGLACAAWLMAWLGLGARYLNRTDRFLVYAGEAVMPFYILHQPVIISIGYFVLKLKTAIPLEYGLITICAFTGIMAVYELGVRRFNPVRFLFGMNPMKKTAATVGSASASLKSGA